MLESADRSIEEIRSFLAARGVEAGYLVPTETGLKKSLMDAHGQFREFLRREGLHDYAAQEKGPKAKVLVTAWHVKPDSLLEATASLYRPETKNGDPRIWITELSKHTRDGNVLALFVHDGDLYVANVSDPDVWSSASSPGTPFAQLLDTISGSKNRPIADTFSAWNLRLLQSFFSEASAGEEVFLRVDKDVLDDIGQDLGGDAGFIEAVRAGPSWSEPNSSLTQRIMALVRQRRFVQNRAPAELKKTKMRYLDPGSLDSAYLGLAAPAYLPYLAMFVRIATTYGEDGYYYHLSQLLGIDREITHDQKKLIEKAWADLEYWTNSCSGKFGHYKLRRLGKLPHIGIPQSQSIFKSADIKRLPIIFKRAGIRPYGDLDNHAIRRILEEAKAEAVAGGTIFSRPLSEALEDNEFNVPITSIIRLIYNDWDGSMPVRNPSNDSSQGNETKRRGLGLGLSVVPDESLAFDIHWILPAIHDSGNFKLSHGDSLWEGAFAGSDGGVTKIADRLSAEAWRIAEAAYNDDVPFELISTLGEESEEIKEQILLEKHLLWLLVPEYDGPEGRFWLKEGDLPGHGSAFLLAPPANVDRLRGYLERESLDHDVIHAEGLPEDWIMIKLNQCGKLTESQRSLPDGAESHSVPRLLRFVGGRSVQRAYSQMYLPYDLPVVELDAPVGAELVCSHGLIAVEQGGRDVTIGLISQLQPIRRFGLRLPSSGSTAYRLEVHLNGNVIGRAATMRISRGDGDLVEMGRPFSLDSLGRPQSSEEGLSGVLPDETSFSASTEDLVDLKSISLESLGDFVTARELGFSAEQKFLDALAQPGVGAMDAGTARKLLGRYLVEDGRYDNPVIILMRLRSCGYIEVSTTHKGHMSRIHAVQPIIYELPVQVSGNRVYGVTGTLRLAHWQALALTESPWTAYRERLITQRLGAIRLVDSVSESIESACTMDGHLERLGFRYARLPSLSIAQWSESATLVHDTSMRNPIENIGRADQGVLRFNAVIGRFGAKPGKFKHELWKTKDLDTGVGSVYYLVDRTENGVRHAFIRDSRWGKWIILDGFARYIMEQQNREDIYPVPFTYDTANAIVWLPARIGLPVVLERALVLCSGALPSEVELVRGEIDGDRLPLFPKSGGQIKLKISPFYSEMADGKWLAYPWVPEAVAAAVAGKLGARLYHV